MPKKIILTEKEKDYIIEQYALPNLSISDIARNLKLDRGVVKRFAKEIGITKKFASKTRGIKYDWTSEKIEYLTQMYASDNVTVLDIADYLETSEDTVTKKAKELNLNKKIKNNFKKEDIDFIRDKFTLLRIKEMASSINMSEESVRKKLIELNLHEEYLLNHKKEKEIKEKLSTIRREAPIDNDNFLWDLSNPYLSNNMIGKKWNIHPDTSGNWRRRLFGKFLYKPKNEEYYTDIENIVRDILIELDIVFYFQYKIDKWSLDFYLGSKRCIEVQGIMFHSSKYQIEKDIRKKNELNNLGYSILYLEEEIIHKNPEEVKKLILGFLQQ